MKASMQRVDELRSKKPWPRLAEPKAKAKPRARKKLPKKVAKAAEEFANDVLNKVPARKAVKKLVDKLEAQGLTPTGRKPRPPEIQHVKRPVSEATKRTVDQLKEALLKPAIPPALYKFADGFVPSPQQNALFDWVVNGEGNAFVEAVAGSGKTTSLLRACSLMKGSIICIAFGAKIKEEFALKLTKMGLDHVQAKTAHAVGWQAMRESPKFSRTKLMKNGEKRDAMLDYLKPAGYREFPPHLRSAVSKLVSLAKQSGVLVTWELGDQVAWEELVEHFSVDDLIPEQHDTAKAIEEAIGYAMCGVTWSLKAATEMSEFDDMCWVPLVEKLRFPKFDWVLVDEAQDLSEMRRLIAANLMHSESRLAAVGDRHQAIFGFTGADADSIDQICGKFKCTRLPLTVTYRCPKAVVVEAQKYVSHITAHESAPDGIVEEMGKDKFENEVITTLTPDTAVICRLNRPLVSLAFRLWRMGIPCHVEGREIGNGLVALARKWRSAKTVQQLHERLTKYLDLETEKLTRLKREGKLEALKDRVETLLVIMEGCEMVTDVVAKIEGMFKDTNGDQRATVTFSTVHKFKGREKPHIIILGFSQYMPGRWAKKDWERGQETNLIYVAITRAMLKLTYLEALDEKKE
jgi:hypothetical protein